jgi:polar amino acid transport system substrate-binding protein
MTTKGLKFTITLVLTLLIAFTGFSQSSIKEIKKRGELRVGMTGNQPPFTMTATDGKMIGYEVDLAVMLAEAMGVELKLVKTPFPDLLNALEAGKVDIVMSGMTMTFERNMRVAFAGPYLLSGKSVLTKSAAFSDTDESDDINDKSIKLVTLAGSTSEAYVRSDVPEAELILVDSYTKALEKLESGEASILVADYPFCAYTVLVHPEKNLITLDQPLTIEPIGMALPPDDAHFYNIVQNYMNALSLIGALEVLEYKWFENGEWVPLVEGSQKDTY